MKKIINLFVMAALLMAGSRSFAQNNHEYVDLGLPSGTLWATCNVGAKTPEEYGDFFAWGETKPKSNYSRSTYKYCNVHTNRLIKYCSRSEDGNNGFTDQLTTLQSGDDPATSWGSGWRMPTKEQCEELLNNTTNKWTIQNNYMGILFTSKKNGRTLFLPAAGYRINLDFNEKAGYRGHYWSSSLRTDYPDDAWNLVLLSDGCGMSNIGDRAWGFSVRPVRQIAPNNNHEYVDLGLPSGTLWATCNVGASTPEGYGDYFAWGETQPKNTYDYSTYKYCNGDYNRTTKYCSQSDFGNNGFTDNLTVLQSGDDAATANWGSDWRMPTADQWRELYENTTAVFTTFNGVKGMLFTASNGRSLFLPAAGERSGDVLGGVGTLGRYWSRVLSNRFPSFAQYLDIDPVSVSLHDDGRIAGYSVRPVRQK